MLGQTVSHYRIVSQLGAGGMGVVYSAVDTRLGRSVALKFVPDELAKDRHLIDRLWAEARAASALNHANICTIYDVGEHDGRPFIVMELINGRSLWDLLAGGPLRPRQVVDIGIQAADALDAAHSRGILHRDIKPANLFLSDRAQIKILDFGLAKLLPRHLVSTTMAETAQQLTTKGMTLGTVAYMSPEQVTGEELDGRTDLFSLGVVLYECATGHRPFIGKTSAVVFSAILNRAPVAPILLNPETPIRLQDIINNCLEKDRDLRYQDAAGLRADLRRLKRDLEPVPSEGARTVGSAIDSSAPIVIPRAAPATPLPSQPAGEGVASSGSRRSTGSWFGIALALSVAVASAASVSYLIWSRSAAPTRDPGANQAVSESATGGRLERGVASPQAKDRGVDIDPSAPAIDEVSRLDHQSKSDAEAARQTQQAQRARPAQPAQTAAPSAAPRPPRASQPPPGPARVPADAPAAAPSEPSRAPADSPASAPLPIPQVATAPSTLPPPPAAVQPPAAVEPPAATTSPSQAENDDEAIRRLVATYARAIETKDVPLFRSVKPNLSAAEQRRIEQGFRAVSSQRVAITIVSIVRRGAEATVRLRRRDTIAAGGRQQTTDSQQTLTLIRTGTEWVIRDIG
jgi:serine/threonine protein kinase